MATKNSKNKKSCRTSHLSKEEKELAVILYKVGIDFSYGDSFNHSIIINHNNNRS